MSQAERMPQPMGPLEQGDQALVEVVHKLEPGEYRYDQDGATTALARDESPYGDKLHMRTDTPDGAVERIAVDIAPSRVPGTTETGAINVHTLSREPDSAEGSTFTSVSDNAMRSRFGGEAVVDRGEAQAAKLELAGRLEQAVQQRPDTQIQDPELARDMAEAERPHRDIVAERQEAAATAQQVAQLAISRFRKGTGSLEAVGTTGHRADMMKEAAEQDITLELGRAREAAEAVQRERQS